MLETGRYLIRRVAGTAVLLLVLSWVVFALLYLAPGSVEFSILGEAVRSPEAVAAVRAQYHLDDPLLVQYGHWLAGAVQLDLGTSIRTGDPVGAMLETRAALTLQLMAMAFVMAIVVAVPLGVLAAVRAGSAVDSGAVGLSVLGLSSPAFATGILLLWLFGVKLGWFPLFGAGEGFVDRLYHLFLPALTLALALLAPLLRFTRAGMLDTLGRDYVGFATARGLSRGRVLRRYALRNAAIPVLTASGLLAGTLLAASVLVEVTFSLPGLGSLIVEAVKFKDLPVVQGLTIVSALLIVGANLLTDLLYTVADPRIRLSGARG